LAERLASFRIRP